jgi:hypothetical protein
MKKGVSDDIEVLHLGVGDLDAPCPSCPKTGSAALCGLPPIVAQYAAEAFVASDRSIACPRGNGMTLSRPW